MNGLTNEEVVVSRKKYGSNNISVKKQNKLLNLIIESLGDPIIKIMLIALAIRFVLLFKDQNWYETLGMLISILLSSLISSLSEYGSNKSFERLQSEYENIKVRVRRNGKNATINNDDVVVDDIVLLTSGELIPADGILLEGTIGVDESSINGESKEVTKVLGQRVFKGSVVLSGSASIRIEKVGINTVYGSIAKGLTENNLPSPMRIRLTKLAKIISRIGYIGAILASVSNIFNTVFICNDFDKTVILSLLSNPKYVVDLVIETVTLAVTIIIVCVPEGLPMMVALVLSSNMKRMLKNNVLVRKAVGIETSGSMNVLLTDKTGTLTKGKLSVIGICLPDDTHFNTLDDMKDDLKNIFIDALLYNNDAYFEDNQVTGGNSTDKAILTFVGKIPLTKKIEDKIHFNSENKYSYVKLNDGKSYYKGASEVLIKLATFYIDNDGNKKYIKDKKEMLKKIDTFTSSGIRVLSILQNNTLLGFILLRDEIREEAASTLKTIEEAGIHTIMITGDDINTSRSIADSLGMIKRDSLVISHDELERMSDMEVYKYYKKIKVIARALPKDKARVAKILEQNNLVVGMTGDGVNDAPALKSADVGISLGSGSEVAKEASDIVIIDNNIKSIESAVLFGRTIFKSIRKFIIFQLTMNLIALFLSIVGPLLGISTPITIMQMLWLNMIMDTLAGLAYSYEYPIKRYMKEKPIRKDEPILNKYMYSAILLISIYSFILLSSFLKSDIVYMFIRNSRKTLMTAFFSLFVFISVFNAFNARTERLNLFANILKNKVFIVILLFITLAQIFLIYNGGSLFRTYGLKLNELIFVIALAFTVIPLDLVRKLFIKYR